MRNAIFQGLWFGAINEQIGTELVPTKHIL